MFNYIGIIFLLIIPITLSQQLNEDNLNKRIDSVFAKPMNYNESYLGAVCPDGLCVPYYLCSENNTISIYGNNILDNRFGANNSTEPCHYLEVCCRTTDIAKEPIKPPENHRKGCGNRNNANIDVRIMGIENEANYGEFPWVVAILEMVIGIDTVKYHFKSGGSLIHPKVVLTAAHCVHRTPRYQLKLRAGEWDSQTTLEIYSYQERDVDKIIVHEKYISNALINDVALIFASTPFIIEDHIQPVCLPPQDFNFDHKYCTVTGWGKDNFGNLEKIQSILKQADLPILTQHDCEENLRKTKLGRYFNLHNSFICAGSEDGKDACTGDGGAPLVCEIPDSERYHQAGVVAWGIGCGDGKPSVYVNVAKFRYWIDNHILSEGLDNKYYIA